MIAVFPLLVSSGTMLAVGLAAMVMSFSLKPIYMLTSVFILATIVATSSWLQVGLQNGSNVESIIVDIDESYALNAVIAIALALSYLCKIILLRNLYKRSKDQYAIAIFGLIMAFITLCCWCVSKFLKNSSFLFIDKTLDSNLAILPTFVYLLRISISVISAYLVLIFIYSNRSVLNLIFYVDNPDSTYLKHLILLFSSVSLICLPIVIFILDLTNTYANLLSEMFNLTADWSSTVIMFFFLKDINSWFKIKQSKGVLGRRQYNHHTNSLNNLNLKRFNRFKSKLIKFNHQVKLPTHTNIPPPQNESVYVHKVARF